MPKNVFVLGLDEENREALEGMPQAEDCDFHQLLTIDELQYGDDIPLAELLERATRQLEEFSDTIDAIVGYWDFPVTLMVAVLSERFGLPSASLRSKLVCEHKYWSRLAQRRVTDAYPAFTAVDPFARDVRSRIDLPYPFWIKPVKSFSSALAHKVTNDEELDHALADLCEHIGRVGKPFEDLLSRVDDVPEEVAALGGSACMVEAAVEGAQATVEGYVLGDEVEVYGVVDSVVYPDVSSFYAFRYPSRLPEEAKARMVDVSRRVIAATGLDLSTFNIEFFWDADTDDLRILEVNPRHSQSHAKLFELVDGLANHAAMLDLALGRRPRLPDGTGPYEIAGKWFVRRFRDGVVARAGYADGATGLRARLRADDTDETGARCGRCSRILPPRVVAQPTAMAAMTSWTCTPRESTSHSRTVAPATVPRRASTGAATRRFDGGPLIGWLLRWP